MHPMQPLSPIGNAGLGVTAAPDYTWPGREKTSL